LHPTTLLGATRPARLAFYPERVEIAAYQHGIFPRSESVVAATRDLERGRTTREAVETAFRNDRDAFVTVQRDAGLGFFSDGLLRWQDLFRPLVDAATGLEADGLVRWFDNNSFYRTPDVLAPPVLSAEPEVFADLDPLPEPRVATLPSPYLFSRAARGLGIVEAAEAMLRPAAEFLVTRRCAVIHLAEPWIGFHGIDQAEWASFEKAVGVLTDGLAAAVVLHVFYGDAAPYLDRLRRLPVAAVGVDLVETDADAVGPQWETGLLAGCLNGRAAVLEDMDATAELAVRVAERAAPPRLFLSSSSELELLPRALAADKVRLLGALAARVREALSA
jgi:5-methyltetrahydropteroyltriglutamate--homocysteine methyltransferase